MPENAPRPAQSPQIVVGDEEIFEAHAAGKLSLELKSPLDT
ncbi:MAG TPA: NAD-dependent malic enzyme, partial [Mycobacterium sp.]